MTGLRHPDPYDGPTARGVDLSFYQGHDVAFALLKRAGFGYVFSRIGDGLGHDSTFAENFRRARLEGLFAGGYQFMRPSLPTIAQADLLLETLAKVGWKKGADLPPVLDVERGDNDGHTVERMIEWLLYVEHALGVRPIVYGGAFAAALPGNGPLATYALWTPSYGHEICQVPKPWAHWTFWQTSGNGQAPGVQGHVDLDVFRGSLSELATFVATPAPVAVVAPKRKR